MIRCIAVDDEPIALDKLVNYISRIPYLDLVASCEDASEAMKIVSTQKVDVMFIDINMPDVNGLDFVRALSAPPMVVFVTAYSDYAVDSYKVRAVDYLLKPYGFEDFQNTAANVYRQRELLTAQKDSVPCTTEPGVLYFKVDYRYVRVNVDDITHVEGMSEYLKVYQTSGDPFLTHMTFRQLLDSLPEYFLQAHRSYVVNMKYVREIERSVITMSDGTHISISEGNKDSFMQYLRSHSVRK